mmetsp:Transcript_16281/g.21409  ORF Transcript_16281/g.21409 Transcript_16281/m.21409 type:complete len:377 (-) Transcript_16281:1684-2814(-)
MSEASTSENKQKCNSIFQNNEKIEGNQNTEPTTFILRVKRKRSAAIQPPEYLLLPRSSKKSKETVEEALANLSVQNKKDLVCKLIDSQRKPKALRLESLPQSLLEKVGSLKRGRNSESAQNEDSVENSGLNTKRIKIFDLSSTDTGILRSVPNEQITLNGKPLKRSFALETTQVQNFDEAMDIAIWQAFQKNDFEPITCAINNGSDVNYSRFKGDQTTALMAAVFHGNIQMVRFLLEKGANPATVDQSGKSAMAFLRPSIGADLRIAIETELDAYEIDCDDEDVMYDIYCVENDKTCLNEGSTTIWHDLGTHQWENTKVIDCSLDELCSTEYLHEEEVESDYDFEDEDSNDENFYRNDYPDEDGDEDEMYSQSDDY